MEKLNPTLLRVSLRSCSMFKFHVLGALHSLSLSLKDKTALCLKGFRKRCLIFFPCVILSLKGKRADFLPDN